MRRKNTAAADEWRRDGERWRSPLQICSQWEEAENAPAELFRARERGAFWELLGALQVTLIVTREYEHLVLGLSAPHGEPRTSFMRLPHPSGIAVDRKRRVVHLASTRNPNVVYDLMPVAAQQSRLDTAQEAQWGEIRPLIPQRARFLPGCSYIHDLALINGELHANAVGENAVIRLNSTAELPTAERVWWPRCIDPRQGGFGQNVLQLNSIAAGKSLAESFFTASVEQPLPQRPGDLDFPVEKRGVVFSGVTREVCTRGLTRPHSARMHRGKVWVLNSGYGEFGVAEANFLPHRTLPGWTRGLCFVKNYAFIGTSRVIPRFCHYAPGLAVDSSVCGVHALDLKSGEVVGSLVWERGNQIFGIESVPVAMSHGFPFLAPTGRGGRAKKKEAEERALFYSFDQRRRH